MTAVYVLPAAIVCVVIWGGALEPKKLNVQGPDSGAVPNGSFDVLEIANPESKPACVVMKGNSRFVTHGVTVSMFAGVDVSANRGTGNGTACVLTASATENIGGAGAKLPLTVIWEVPMSGGADVEEVTMTPKLKLSMTEGSEAVTSQTAVAVPLTTCNWTTSTPSSVVVLATGE